MMSSRAGYASAGRAGFALGLVLLSSFLIAGRGLGASGAFALAAGGAVNAVAPSALTGSATLADRLPAGVPIWNAWIVVELLAVFAGGAISAGLAGRLRRDERHPSNGRLARALLGGALMGLGARLAYGCTSGLALSGGALLATGAWVFIPVAFGTAMLVTTLAARARQGGAA
jgi:uncharacterized membrane protein YedE/YeeE